MRDASQPLTCGAVRELVLQGLQRGLPPAEDARLRSHLSGCAPCAREVELDGQIGQILRRDPLPVDQTRLPSGEALARSVVEAARQRGPAIHPAVSWAGCVIGVLAGLLVVLLTQHAPVPLARSPDTPAAVVTASPGFWIEDDEQTGRTVVMESRPPRPVTR